MRLYKLFFVLMLFLPITLMAQNHISVDLGDPAYQILDNAQQRGLLPLLPTVKPYSRSQVLRYLEALMADVENYTPEERLYIREQIDRLSGIRSGWEHGGIGMEGKTGYFRIGIEEESDVRVNAFSPEDFHMFNGIGFTAEGDILNFLSYSAMMGGSIDKVSPDIFYRKPQNPIPSGYSIRAAGGFAPYQYSRKYGGFHVNPQGSLTDGTNGDVWIGFLLGNEITTQFFEDDLTLRFGMMRRNWGYGDRSLTLSSTARPFEAAEFLFSPVKWFHYYWMVGSLGNWFTDSAIEDETGLSAGKMYSLQALEIQPWPWLKFSVTSSCVWGKRFELGYLNPLLIGAVYQNMVADFDNVALTFDLEVSLPYVGVVYGSFFLDEFTFSNPLANPRMMWAGQLGVKVPLPILDFTTITLQGTKIEPFTYAHYPESNYPDKSNPVDMSYTNDGENLAYYLPPNSLELLAKFETMPYTGLMTTLTYRFIAHGTSPSYVDADNDGLPDGTGIYGNIYIPINYDLYDDGQYDDKDFLNDGVYDFTHMVSIGASYRFKKIDCVVGAEYTFSYTTFNDAIDSGVDLPDPVLSNFLAINVKLFH